MLKEALKRHAISQRQFALMIDTDYSAVNRWATGKAAIPGAVRLLLILLDARPELAVLLRKMLPHTPRVKPRR